MSDPPSPSHPSSPLQNYCEDQTQNSAAGKSRTRGGGGAKAGAPGKESPVGAGYSTVISKNIRGFTDSEIRRFVKSYRKFINPKARQAPLSVSPLPFSLPLSPPLSFDHDVTSLFYF